MKMAQHFKAHGYIHAFWIFVIMASIIGALLIISPNGQAVNNYISFASSIASLILAVVAIFYSMISNQSFSEAVGSLRGSALEVGDAAKQVGSVSQALNESSAGLIKEIVTFRPKFEEISTKLDARISPDKFIDNATSMGGKQDSVLKMAPTAAGLMSLYIIAKAKITGKYIVCVEDIFKDNKIWEMYCIGCLESIRIYRVCGMEISKSDPDDNGKAPIQFKGFGDFNDAEIALEILSDEWSDLREYQKNVDDYFDGLTSDEKHGLS